MIRTKARAIQRICKGRTAQLLTGGVCALLLAAPARAQFDPFDWVVVESPNVGFTYNVLISVEVVSPSDVWSGGFHLTTGVDPGRRTFLIHWDGLEWSHVATPNPGSGDNLLTDLVALASDDVWAVGLSDEGDPNDASALILHWDGATWSSVSAPQPHRSTILTSASAIAPDDIWAAGYTGVWGVDPEGMQPLVMHYDGESWTVVHVPSLPIQTINPLNDIVALAPDNVWAVGYSGWPNVFETLVYHFDGEAWSRVPSPNPADRGSRLFGVCSITPDDMWAVGEQFITGVGKKTLTIHWDGHGWTVVPSPNRLIAGSWNYLWDVQGNASDDVWAVGMNQISTVLYPHAMHWNGEDWTYVELPDVAYSSRVDALAVLPDGSAWTVGSAERFQGPTLSLVEFHQGQGIPGDIDRDGDVDLADLATLLAAFGTCDGDPGYNPDADLDSSGCVDLADLATLLANFGA